MRVIEQRVILSKAKDRPAYSRPSCSKIFPQRVRSLDQRHLFASQPAFDLLFPRNRLTWRAGSLYMDELSDSISMGEAGRHTTLMFQNPSTQVISYAYVQSAGFAGEEIDEVGPGAHASRSFASLRMTRFF
jgi:hypothetical protein